MGNMEPSIMNAGLPKRGATGQVVVAASEKELAALASSAPAHGLQLHCLSGDAALPASLLQGARVLVLEVDAASSASMRRLAEVHAVRPGLPVVAAMHDTSLAATRALLRQGVSDVLILPFELSELVSRAMEAASHDAAPAPAAPVLCPMLALARSAGGSGTTTIITHLADALASTQRRVCIIDLDLQGSAVAGYLGQSPNATVLDLVNAGERLDKEFLDNAICSSGRGFDFIAGPQAIVPTEQLDVGHLMRLMRLARENYDIVLVDLPADWTSWALSLAAASQSVLLVTDLSLSNLRQARRRLDLFSSVGIERSQIGLIVNRVERRLFRPIGIDDATAALGHPVTASLSAEPDLALAQDQGVLLSELNPKARYVKDIAALAGQIIARIEENK